MTVTAFREGGTLKKGADDVLAYVDRRLAAVDPLGSAVGGDHALVDAPSRLDLHVLIAREHSQPLTACR